MANRPKLTIEDQVAYMKNKGITFDHCSEKDAVRFLQESTYFFKVKAFDKNYIAHPKTGHYYNLDFSYLMELSTLDMRLRRLILHATLDIEHFLKVQLIRDVSSNPVEDGYQIVEKFFSENSSVKNSISEKSKNSMCKDLVEKLESENYAIWNLIEVLSFGECEFFHFPVRIRNICSFDQVLLACLRRVQLHEDTYAFSFEFVT